MSKIGIVVSGGPAPGINSVISSAVIAAFNLGYGTVGLNEGFRGVALKGADAVKDLSINEVSRIYKLGGSVIGTSRFNPFASPETTKNFEKALSEKEIDKLIVIGGEGSAYLSLQISKKYPNISVVHVPKTIDNDLDLPNDYPSFGFETARSVGTKIVDTLCVDAKTTQRWFLVTSMGRKAGFLALGLGLSSRATITLIPEEFEAGKATPENVADILFNSIKKRSEMGKNFGVAVMAEGLIDMLNPDSHPLLQGCPRDELGRIKHSELELGDLLTPLLKKRCDEEKIETVFYNKNLGYELRCADPTSFDIEYTTFLGLGAVSHLHDGQKGVMVIRDHDKIGSIPLSDMERGDGRIRSRKVNLDSDVYRVARMYMIR